MTRDTQGLLDERGSNDADVYAALWEAAAFPRLPRDAPSELKWLTIDIDDPKRVYAIHRASRRHHFQSCLRGESLTCPPCDLELISVTDTSINFDTAVKMNTAQHRHAFLAGKDSLEEHRSVDTMQRVRGRWRSILLPRTIQNKDSATAHFRRL